MRKRTDQRQPAADAVAGVTSIAGHRMVAGFWRTHATDNMTPHTLIRGLTVVEWRYGRQPCRSSVASFAGIGSQRMTGWLARRLTHSGVTSCGAAVGQNGLSVIHFNRQPGWIAVTKLTGIAGRWMITRFATGRADAIVTAGSSAIGC